MDSDSTYQDLFDDFVNDLPQFPLDFSLEFDLSEGEIAKLGSAQGVFNREAPFGQDAIGVAIDGFGIQENSFNHSANASSKNHTEIVPSGDQAPFNFTEEESIEIEAYSTWPHASEHDDAQDWGSSEDNLAHDPSLISQTASNDPQQALQPTVENQLSNGNIDGTQKLTSDRVLRRLRSVRAQTVQPAVTTFQTQDAAKAWRKRGQTQVLQPFQDTSLPSSPAEERDCVYLLKNAFDFMGTGCKYTEQQRLFVTRLNTNDGKKEVESWCWRLLKEMVRRQSEGRPKDIARRKTASLDEDLQTFAERFAAVFNALRLEKRCCIRFSNMADWHKRLANDPISEVADITKNDLINDKRAQDRKAKYVEAKELAKALDEEKSKSMPKKPKLDEARITTD